MQAGTMYVVRDAHGILAAATMLRFAYRLASAFARRGTACAIYRDDDETAPLISFTDTGTCFRCSWAWSPAGQAWQPVY